jgi:hypothetical protein
MVMVEVTRQEMIEALTRYELEFIASGNASDDMDHCVRFFVKGGFDNWMNSQLIRKYREDIAPEGADVALREGT